MEKGIYHEENTKFYIHVFFFNEKLEVYVK